MGQSVLGGVSHEGNVDMLTPQQQGVLSDILGGQGMAGGAMNQFLQPYDPEQMQDVFQKSIVDPAMQQYQQQVIPGIQQQFGDQNAGASSALNQALASSAQNLGTQLGAQYGDFYNQSMGRTQNALQQLLSGATSQTFSPMINQSQGLLPGLISAGGQIGGGWLGGAPMRNYVDLMKQKMSQGS